MNAATMVRACKISSDIDSFQRDLLVRNPASDKNQEEQDAAHQRSTRVSALRR